jgi:protein-tyrosine kinase
MIKTSTLSRFGGGPGPGASISGASISGAGAVPSVARNGFKLDPNLPMLGASADARAEAFRALRTQLVAQHLGEGRCGLAVCAASDGVGATFAAVNLALGFSQIGLRTLLIDGNLRRPSIDRFIQPQGGADGLVRYLQGHNTNVAEIIDEEVTPNLSILYSGVASNPQELLASFRFRAMMETVLRDFDVTIVDGQLIASLVGYGLIVARRDHSFVADVKTLSSQLTGVGVKVVGTILNDA